MQIERSQFVVDGRIGYGVMQPEGFVSCSNCTGWAKLDTFKGKSDVGVRQSILMGNAMVKTTVRRPSGIDVFAGGDYYIAIYIPILLKSIEMSKVSKVSKVSKYRRYQSIESIEIIEVPKASIPNCNATDRERFFLS